MALPTKSTDAKSPHANTYIHGTKTGYVRQRAGERTAFASREAVLEADASMQIAWDALKAGVVAVKSGAYRATPHVISPECRAYSGAIPPDRRRSRSAARPDGRATLDARAAAPAARLTLFTAIAADGRDGHTLAVQVTIDDPVHGFIDLWSGNPRETRLIDHARVAATVFGKK